jgi:hypothetical protein
VDDNIENYRGFTGHFANEFILPQISFWLSNVFEVPKDAIALEKEYYGGMRKAVIDISSLLSGPRQNMFASPHEHVLHIEQVEILKGLLGDNYRFHKKLLDMKKQIGSTFINTSREEEAIKNMDMYFTHIAPGLADSVKKKLFAPMEETNNNTDGKEYDVFLSHASEDKDFVEPLANELRDAGVKVWYDGFRLEWGDNLRSSIDRGLLNSRYGIVVFSKSFLGKKKWTEHEVNGLFAREDNEKIILPIWHKITREELLKYSPAFADKLAKNTSDLSINEIVEEVKKLLNGTPQA